MYIKKWNEFKINENVQQSLRILKDLGIQSNDIPYKLIKNMLGKNPSYMGMFTSFYYEENVSIEDLESLFKFLKSNLSSRLSKNPLQYDSYESLIDDIQLIEKDNAVRKVINELPREQKDLLPENIQDDDNLYNLLYEISLITNKGFFSKIKKINTYEDFIDLVEDYVKKFKVGASADSIINIINTKLRNDQCEVIYNDEDRGYLVILIKDYESLALLGSTNWCIVNQMSTYLNYVDKGGDNIRYQYIIYDFNEEIGDPDYMIGATVDRNDNITNSHDYNDGDTIKTIYSILPEDIISLLVGPDQEYIDDYKQRRVEIGKERERLEREANRRRIAQRIRDNDRKRENGEWDDDEYVQALRLFLIDKGEIEEDEDIYDVIFESDDYTHYNDGRIFEVPSGAEYVVYNNDEATEAAIENQENLIDDIGAPSDMITKYIDGERFADYYVDEDYYRDNWMDYDISPSEDDEDEPDEDELEKFIQKEKDNIADDPYEYLKDIGYDSEQAIKQLGDFMTYGWEREVAEEIVEMDGRGHCLSGYDGIENESTYNGTTYYIYRLN